MPSDRALPDSQAVVLRSSIAYIDETGELLYRGHSIHQIAETLSFEETAFLLWEGRMPTAQESQAFTDELATYREAPDAALEVLRITPEYAHPMAALRTAVSLLACVDPDQDDSSQEANLLKAKTLLAQLPTIVAAQQRIRQNREAVSPDPQLSHAANYLYMLSGKRPDATSAHALTVAMNLYAEHELDSSSFAARVVVGTQSDYYSAMVAAIGALKGPLHAAVEGVMRMLMAIGSADRAAEYADAAFAAHRRLPGFGHVIYATEDPRTVHMKAALEGVLEGAVGDQKRWLSIAEALEAHVRRKRSLSPNVHFYAAPLLHHLGFELDIRANFVASAMAAGWAAHILEQYRANRPIRPRAEYIGRRNGLH